jgi:hypothetical protein
MHVCLNCYDVVGYVYRIWILNNKELLLRSNSLHNSSWQLDWSINLYGPYHQLIDRYTLSISRITASTSRSTWFWWGLRCSSLVFCVSLRLLLFVFVLCILANIYIIVEIASVLFNRTNIIHMTTSMSRRLHAFEIIQ